MSTLEAVSYLVAISYVVVFLAMTAAAARRAGKPIWLFSKGSERQTVPAFLFRLSFVGAVVWPLILALLGNPLKPDPVENAFGSIWLDLAGHSLCVIGACVAMLSQMHMGASWRIGAAKGALGVIVTSGPFEYSRNPVFLGQMILFVGLFLVLPGIVQGLLTLALVVAVQMQVRIEERVLAADLGEPYRAYCAQVRRWL